jgi:hypothetical protein
MKNGHVKKSIKKYDKNKKNFFFGMASADVNWRQLMSADVSWRCQLASVDVRLHERENYCMYLISHFLQEKSDDENKCIKFPKKASYFSNDLIFEDFIPLLSD